MAKGKDIRAGGGFVTLDVRNRLAKGLNAASAQLKAFGASMTSAGATATAAGLAIVGPILGAVNVFTSLGDVVDKVSARTGLSAEAVSELGYAAETSGASIQALEKANAKLGDSVEMAQRGSKTQAESFEAIGLSVDQLAKLNPEQRFYAVADALAGVEDMSRRGALAQMLLGRAGRQLLPLLAGGSKGLDDLRAHARELGYTIDQQTASSAAELGDRLSELWKQLKVVAFWIGSAVAEELIAFVQAAAPVLRTVIDWIKANREMIAIAFRVGAAVVAVGGILTALGLTFSVIGAAIGGLVPILGVLLSPIGLVVAALAIAGVAFFRFTAMGRAALQSIVDALAPFVEIIKRTFQGVFDAIAAGDWQLAGKIAVAGLRVALIQGFSNLATWLDGALGDLVGTLVSQLAAGDLSGAWNTIVLQMAAIWDSFAEGVVAVFTQAARAVVDLWQKTTTAISKQILALAANDGIVGTVFSKLIGVDVRAEQERAQRLGLGDFVAQSQAIAGEQIAGQADNLRGQLDQLDREARERSAASAQAIRDRTAGGVEAAAGDAAKANAELDALLKTAAEQRKAVAEERRQALGDGAFEIPELDDAAAQAKSETRGTFSGFAAQAIAGVGRRPTEERIAKGVEGMAADTKKIARAADRGLAFA